MVQHHHHPWKFGGGDIIVMMVAMRGRYACCWADGEVYFVIFVVIGLVFFNGHSICVVVV